MSGEGEGGAKVRHPAKFSQSIIEVIAQELDELEFRGLILDPFAGTGRVHQLWNEDRITFGVEIEREWADVDERTIQGDVLKLGEVVEPGQADAIVTSPVYGNRLSDHFNAKDGSKRHSYKFYLGRDLAENNAGRLQWGPSQAAIKRYKDFHVAAWGNVVEALKDGGVFVLNISDHMRKIKGVQRQMPVTAWHLATLRGLGIEWMKKIPVETPRLGHGENRDARALNEWVCIGRKKG